VGWFVCGHIERGLTGMHAEKNRPPVSGGLLAVISEGKPSRYDVAAPKPENTRWVAMAVTKSSVAEGCLTGPASVRTGAGRVVIGLPQT
jgi:hypothetical protein